MECHLQACPHSHVLRGMYECVGSSVAFGVVVFLFSFVLLFTCFVCIISQIQPQLVLFHISLVSQFSFFAQ